MNILDELKKTFNKGSIIIKLIFANIAVFLLANILIGLFNAYFYYYLTVPANLMELVFRPWSPLTYMFLHIDLWHILFNMLWLFWFGRIFLHFLTERQLFSTYILGGLSGAALFIISYNIFPGLELGAVALGASGAVMAIVIAVSVYRPDFAIQLVFFGPVKIKYIAIFTVLMDIASIAGSNAGGHIAHLGGAIFGYWFANQVSKGNKPAQKFEDFIARLTASVKEKNVYRSKKNLHITYKNAGKPRNDMEYNSHKKEMEDEMNRILDKISKHGYQSLTKEEKDLLFRMSDKGKK